MSVTREYFRANVPRLVDQCVSFVAFFFLKINLGQQEVGLGFEIVVFGLDHSFNDLFGFEGELQGSVLGVVLRYAFVIGALGVEEGQGCGTFGGEEGVGGCEFGVLFTKKLQNLGAFLGFLALNQDFSQLLQGPEHLEYRRLVCI